MLLLQQPFLLYFDIFLELPLLDLTYFVLQLLAHIDDLLVQPALFANVTDHQLHQVIVVREEPLIIQDLLVDVDHSIIKCFTLE